MTIGLKREEAVDKSHIGPGVYNIQQADSLVKYRNPTIDLEKREGRKDMTVEDTPAPGQYDHEQKDQRKMTIGEKRDI